MSFIDEDDAKRGTCGQTDYLRNIVRLPFFVATQDFQVFPGVLASILGRPPAAPKDVEEILLTTKDAQHIVMWRAKVKDSKRNQVALLFHGNAETLENFVQIQRWFRSLGFTSYAVEYRGYGRSSGWPSERGIYLDAQAAIEEVIQREHVSTNDIIVLGNSIGSGPAAFVANEYKVGTLVLIAPYTSLNDVVREMPFFGYLSPFLWTSFPTKRFVQGLSNTCVVAAHGKHDSTIPYHHSLELKNSYQGSRGYALLSSEGAGHNDIFGSEHQEIARAIDNCLKEGDEIR